MSETPSLYDLTQDALIGPMRDILLTAAEPPSGPEFSYPVVDQAVSSSMWQWITMGTGSGVIDIGGEPYNLVGLDNGTNTARLVVSYVSGTANAIVRGFFHQLSDDMTISLPMPASGTTTYRICLTYDPRNEAEAEGPVSVQVYTQDPPSTFGRIHVLLWTVRRQANQLLTDASVMSHRARIAPTLLVSSRERLPEPSDMPWGTMCFNHQYGEWFIASGATAANGGPTSWRNVTSPAWSTGADTGNYVWPGHGHRRSIQRVGNTRRLRGRIARANGAAFTPGNSYMIWAIDAQDAPANSGKMVVAGSGETNPSLGVVQISPGDMYVRLYPKDTMSWVSLDGVQWDTE